MNIVSPAPKETTNIMVANATTTTVTDEVPERPPKISLEERATSMLAEEENYPEPETLQEELNAIIDAFYEVVQESDILAYQRYVEDIQGQKIAEQALMEPSMAPDFELRDQDGDLVSLSQLLQKGPVVLTFYRGKWCPHCNATLMRYGKHLVPALQPHNATLVAISPMLPDGTAFLASKRDLQFPICSDLNNELAQKFRITFRIQPHSHEYFIRWGDNLPQHNGLEAGWEIPLPATYVIHTNGQIVWSFVDNDPGVRANIDEIVEQVAKLKQLDDISQKEDNLPRSRSLSPRRTSRHELFNRKIATTFTSPFAHNHGGMTIPKMPKFWTTPLLVRSKSSGDKTETTHEGSFSESEHTIKESEHTMSHDLVALQLQGDDDCDCDGSSHSATSTKSDRLPSSKAKKKLRKTRSAVEFLAKYSLRNHAQ